MQTMQVKHDKNVYRLTVALRAGAINLFDVGVRHPCEHHGALRTEPARASHLKHGREATGSDVVAWWRGAVVTGEGSAATGRCAPSDGSLGRILRESVVGCGCSCVTVKHIPS